MSKDTGDLGRVSDAIKETSAFIESQPIALYQIPLKNDKLNVKGCNHFTFGKESIKCNRTIIVLGATGTGKTTLINAIINYILGVEWEDSYRFKLVDEGKSKSQAFSQTSEVNVYKINHQQGFKMEHSLTIIDTPGFGDTRGIDRDREIVEQLRNLFNAEVSVSEIDAVCFLAQAALARLTATQKYVFDSVLSIFGKDVADNIRILVTFADNQRPPVLEAIKVSGVPCPKTKDGLPVYFKFNNSAFFSSNQTSDSDEDENFDKMFWNMGVKNMKNFFAALNVIETKSLKLTKEVLKERQQIEVEIESLQKQVKLGLCKLEEIRETGRRLEECEAEIKRNKNYEFEVTVMKPVQEDISRTGNFITNCQTCQYTCHYTCAIANDQEKKGCAAMGPNGYCNVCPLKCHWTIHFNQKYKWAYEEFKQKQTIKDLENKYLKATNDKVPVQAMTVRLQAEYDKEQTAVVKLMENSAKRLNKLKEIALKPNPLSTPEYIDVLIESEKQDGKPGWQERINSLTSMREQAVYLDKVQKGGEILKPRLDMR